MKWTNKGHEFDELGERLINNPTIYIYGAGDYGKKLYKSCEWLNVPVVFIDANHRKQKQGYMGQKVISPKELFEMEIKPIIAIAAMPSIACEIAAILEDNGYQRDVDYWEIEDFYYKVLPIYMKYLKNKVFVNSICFISTTICNLNCDGCLNFTYYNKKQKHKDLKEHKQTLSLFFQNIDFIRFFSYSGGEPLLYPHIDELLEFIGEHFIEQIQILGISTNGTIIPKDSTCEILKKYGMRVFIDDYSEFVERSKEIIPLIEQKLQAHDVVYTVNYGSEDGWFDVAPLETDNSYMADEELIRYRDACDNPLHELKEGKISSCSYASFAVTAKLQEDSDNDWYDLRKHQKERDTELIEFLMGYTSKGYVDFCKHCASRNSTHKKPVGRQLKRE